MLDLALQVLERQEDPDGLQMVLGLATRGARECNARKRYSFCTIVNRVNTGVADVLSLPPSSLGAELAPGAGCGLYATNASGTLPAPPRPSPTTYCLPRLSKMKTRAVPCLV